MELFSIRIQRTFQLVSTVNIKRVVSKYEKLCKLLKYNLLYRFLFLLYQ